MAKRKRKSFLSGLIKSNKSVSSSKGFADAMKILRSTRPTKRRNAKPRSGIFK